MHHAIAPYQKSKITISNLLVSLTNQLSLSLSLMVEARVEKPGKTTTTTTNRKYENMKGKRNDTATKRNRYEALSLSLLNQEK